MEYYKKEGDKVICLLCAHHCKIKEGQSGICGVNANIGGEYKNLVYGHPSALHIDPVEKKPLYHFLPSSRTLSLGTVGCNFKCPFCQNWQLSQNDRIDTGRFITPDELVEAALAQSCQSISFTYNEPTIFYPYAKDIALKAHEKGLKTIFVTNGFESKEVLADMPGIIDAANIDLKCFNEKYYKKDLKGGLQQVRDTIKTMVQKGIWVEVTTLLIEGVNDSDEEIMEMAEFLSQEVGEHIPWHISAFHPQYKMQDHHSTQLKTIERACGLGRSAGMKYIYAGNVALDYSTECPGCHVKLIRRNGFKVLENRVEGGHCPKCKVKVEGIWK